MIIKFVSLNIWQGNLLPAIIDFLQEQDADIVVLQEVYNTPSPDLPDKYRTLSILRNKLAYEHSAYAPAFLDSDFEVKVEQGNLTFSKFPIVDQKITFFHGNYTALEAENPKNYPVLPRNLQHIVLDSPAGNLNVFNLHGIWDLDGNNYSPQRRKMSQTITKQINGKNNVILAGDTNADTSNRAIKDLEQHLASVFGNKLKTTFNMERKDKPGYANAAVDMMFASPGMKIIEKYCPKVDVSDHLPLVVSFEI